MLPQPMRVLETAEKRALQAMWRARFATHVQQATGRLVYRGFDWHAFSYAASFDAATVPWSELRTGTASCSSAGWCWVSISPYAITPGTHYRVWVNTNTQQSKTPCGLGSGITNGPLTAHQGRWVAGDTAPTTGSCSNYFVDVQFDM